MFLKRSAASGDASSLRILLCKFEAIIAKMVLFALVYERYLTSTRFFFKPARPEENMQYGRTVESTKLLSFYFPAFIYLLDALPPKSVQQT